MLKDLKENYKGYELHAYREESMGGDELLYYSVFAPNGYEVSSGFYTGSESPQEYMQFLRETADDHIENPEDYD